MATTTVVDSGYGWVVCAASFMVLVVEGGFIYTSGIFYIMFKEGLDAGDTALSAITSLNTAMIYLACPGVGMLTEQYGERLIAMVGAAFSTAGLAFSAFSTQVYHLYIVYGVVAGVGMGMTFNPSISILSKYFHRHNRTATGLAMCGLGVGSFVIPPVIKTLEDAYGWIGAILMMAGINAHTFIFCSFFKPVDSHITRGGKSIGTEGTSNKENSGKLKAESSFPEEKIPLKEVLDRRDDVDGLENSNGQMLLTKVQERKVNLCTPALEGSKGEGTMASKHDNKQMACTNQHNERKAKDDHSGNIFFRTLSLFRNISFVCTCLNSLFLSFPVSIIYTHFGSYIISIGFPSTEVVQLYMVMGITSTITRPLMGWLAQITQANIAMLMLWTLVLGGVLTLSVPFTHHLAVMYLYDVVIQVLLSPYNVLCPTCVVESVPKEQIAAGYGIVCAFCVPGFGLGAPLAAWLYGVTSVYGSSFYLAGVLMAISGLVMVPMSYLIHVDRRVRDSKGIKPNAAV